MLKDVHTKLRVKAGTRLLILNAPDSYLSASDEQDLSVTIDTEVKTEKYPFVQLFTKNRQELQIWAEKTIQSLAEGGLLWICYPKKTSSLYEDLSRDEGWDAVTAVGMEGVALISIDETWSAMRFRPQNTTPEKKKRAPRESKVEKTAPQEFAMPEELKEKLKANSEAATFYENLGPSYKKIYLEWVVSAKREETKRKRINEMIEKLTAGYKNPYAK
jgi:hypothetical protein